MQESKSNKRNDINNEQAVAASGSLSVKTRATLTIILLAIIVITVGISAGIVFTQDNLRDTIEADMTVVGDVVDKLVSTEIDLLKANGAIIAHNLEKASPDVGVQILEQALEDNPQFIGLTVFDKNGILTSVGSTPTPPELLDSDQYLRRALKGESVISTTRSDPSGRLVMHICVPSSGDKAISITIDGFHFSNLLHDYKIWDTGHIIVVDAQGTVIADPNTDWVFDRYNFIDMAKTNAGYEELADTVSLMTEAKSGVTEFSLDNKLQICAFQPITASRAGWSLAVVAPISESPANRVRNGMLLVGLICLVLSIVAGLVASGIIEKPFIRIKRQETYLSTINSATSILIGAAIDDFENALQRCLGMFASGIDVDRVRIWKNNEGDGGLCCNKIYEWPDSMDIQSEQGNDTTIRYSTDLPNWGPALAMNKCVKGKVSTLPEAVQNYFKPLGTLSILAVPIFYQEKFWGFISLSDCHDNAREFSGEEEDIIRSGAMLFANAMLKNEMMVNLIEAREEAISSTEAKSDFLATISHEMRTPLNAIIGLSELTLDAGNLSDENFGNLERVYTSGMTLLSLINDILDISKMESGKFDLVPVNYDMPSLINDTTTLNIVRIGSRPIEFNLDLDENLPDRLIGDELRIKQIFNNLLSNAFKYTEEGSVTWKISSERDGDDIWIVSSVTDTGIGIKTEDMEKLFSGYSQLDTKRNRKIEGTGLGLTITKQLVEMMSGEMTVESQYGKGSTFKVRLKQEYSTNQIIGAAVVNNLKAFRYSVQKRDRSSKMIRTYIPYAKVLVVDDVQTNLDVAKGMLKPYGMKVDCVTSGIEAIKLIKTASVEYNAIFMDHMMPGMDGIEAVRIIRQEIGTDYAKNIPIIALTANAILGNEDMFLSNGFQAFISKPIDIMRLDTIINLWVRDREKEKSNKRESDKGHNIPLDKRSGIDRRVLENRRTGHDRRDNADLNAAAGTILSPALNRVDGLDIHAGLKLFGNDEESYIEVLASFLRNTPPLLDRMQVFKDESLPDYAIIVHGIKSSSRTIGAAAVGAKAEALENAAKTDDHTFVSTHHDEFNTELRTLIENVIAAMPDTKNEDDKPLKPEPDKVELKKLREACLSYDTTLIDEALQALEEYKYETGADLIAWLREQVDAFDFKQISERLGKE